MGSKASSSSGVPSHIIIFIMTVILVFVPRETSAGTIGEMMSVNCPAAASADGQLRRAYELAEDGQSVLAKRAAELYYDCYRTVVDPYARDWAHEFYLETLLASWETTAQHINVLVVVIKGTNDLAAATAFDDVRSAALQTNNAAKQELSGLTP